MNRIEDIRKESNNLPIDLWQIRIDSHVNNRKEDKNEKNSDTRDDHISEKDSFRETISSLEVARVVELHDLEGEKSGEDSGDEPAKEEVE